MSYRFIIGGAGSGKTEYAFREMIEKSVKNPDRKYIIIVPEQNNLITQRKVMKLHPNKASLNIEVTSFSKLSKDVFNELGIDLPLFIDEIAKAVIIRKLAFENKEKLGVLKEQFSKVGFINSMKSVISEFYQYGIMPQDIAELNKNELKPALRDKLKDIEIIFSSFREFIKGKYISTQEHLIELSKLLHKSKIFDDAEVIIDSFVGFSPVQYKILAIIMSKAKQLDFILTSDENIISSDVKDTELFFLSKQVYKNIEKLAQKERVKKLEDVYLNTNYRFKNSASLSHIEKYFLRDETVKKENKDDIKILKVRNPEEEADFVTDKILSLVKKEGYRYKDIAVVSGDINSLANKLEYRFALNNIPYYTDLKLALNHNILINFVRAVILCVVEDYSYNSMMYLLRSPLYTKDRDIVCMLDNYLYASGIRGLKRLKKDFTYVPSHLKGIDINRLNEFKNKFIADFDSLYKVMRSRELKPEIIISEIKALFEKLNIEDKLKELSEYFEKQGDFVSKREYERVYEGLIEFFRILDEILGKEVLDKKEFTDILDAGLSQLKIETLPAKLDVVTIGDITRTRLDDVKVLFLLAANDGVIPSAGEKYNIISDAEKEILKELGIELSDTLKEDLFRQRYYLYLMLTRAKDKLFISFESIGADGKARKKSALLNNISELFTNLKTEEYINDNVALSREQARKKISAELRKKIEDKSFTFSKEFIKLKDIIEIKDLIEAASTVYKDNYISKEAAKNIFGKTLNTSITRLESYIDCPYSHFLRYGLNLSGRKEYEIAALNIGNLVHEAIEDLFKALKNKNIDITGLSEYDRNLYLEESLLNVLKDEDKNIYDDSAKNKYIKNRIINLIKRNVEVLVNQLKRGDFIPYEFEFEFGIKENLKALNIDLGETGNLKLRGKIDRVDICETEDKILAKIIDYKTGNMSMELDLAYYGRQIQLIMYMHAIEEVLKNRFKDKDIIPAAMFYYNLREPYFSSRDLEKGDLDSLFSAALKPDGIVNTDLDIIRHLDKSIEKESDVIPVSLKDGVLKETKSVASTRRIRLLQDFVRDRAGRTGKEILSGNIDIRPAKRGQISACTYCEYSGVCGFDTKIKGFKNNNLLKIDTKEIWEKIEDGKLD